MEEPREDGAAAAAHGGTPRAGQQRQLASPLAVGGVGLSRRPGPGSLSGRCSLLCKKIEAIWCAGSAGRLYPAGAGRRQARTGGSGAAGPTDSAVVAPSR